MTTIKCSLISCDQFEAHNGPVWSLERNPGFLKNFLTVGDWTARVWSEDCRESAVLWSPPLRHKITAGTWSPTRFSHFLSDHTSLPIGPSHIPMRYHNRGTVVICNMVTNLGKQTVITIYISHGEPLRLNGLARPSVTTALQ